MTARELAGDICRTLQFSGFKAYLVGGCVRDLVLGREPEDYDVATDAHPARVQELFPSSVDVGARFGVILVAGDGVQVEVATFRSDVGYSDGRHPDRVEYSSLPEEDVRRRDFTINGLMLDMETQQVLDFVGGREDLRQGIVRAIGAPELRSHPDFLMNLKVPASMVKTAFLKCWAPSAPLANIPFERINLLAREKYGTDEWNLKF